MIIEPFAMARNEKSPESDQLAGDLEFVGSNDRRVSETRFVFVQFNHQQSKEESADQIKYFNKLSNWELTRN